MTGTWQPATLAPFPDIWAYIQDQGRSAHGSMCLSLHICFPDPEQLSLWLSRPVPASHIIHLAPSRASRLLRGAMRRDGGSPYAPHFERSEAAGLRGAPGSPQKKRAHHVPFDKRFNALTESRKPAWLLLLECLVKTRNSSPDSLVTRRTTSPRPPFCSMS